MIMIMLLLLLLLLRRSGATDGVCVTTGTGVLSAVAVAVVLYSWLDLIFSSSEANREFPRRRLDFLDTDGCLTTGFALAPPAFNACFAAALLACLFLPATATSGIPWIQGCFSACCTE